LCVFRGRLSNFFGFPETMCWRKAQARKRGSPDQISAWIHLLGDSKRLERLLLIFFPFSQSYFFCPCAHDPPNHNCGKHAFWEPLNPTETSIQPIRGRHSFKLISHSSFRSQAERCSQKGPSAFVIFG
jgi:hypothetical protein